MKLTNIEWIADPEDICYQLNLSYDDEIPKLLGISREEFLALSDQEKYTCIDEAIHSDKFFVAKLFNLPTEVKIPIEITSKQPYQDEKDFDKTLSDYLLSTFRFYYYKYDIELDDLSLNKIVYALKNGIIQIRISPDKDSLEATIGEYSFCFFTDFDKEWNSLATYSVSALATKLKEYICKVMPNELSLDEACYYVDTLIETIPDSVVKNNLFEENKSVIYTIPKNCGLGQLGENKNRVAEQPKEQAKKEKSTKCWEEEEK